MGTFEKSYVQEKGLQDFIKEQEDAGAYKIYESDTNFHVVHDEPYERALLNSRYVRNPQVVWTRTR